MKKVFLPVLIGILFTTCKKSSSDPGNTGLATVTTSAVSAITSTTATSGGNITNDGGAAITERGICFHTVANPTTSNNKVASGSGTGTFTSDMTGLTGGMTYYIRAYAVNSAGTAYGNEVSFTTSPAGIDLAMIRTTNAVNITDTTASAGGVIQSDGGAAVTERGICFNTSADPNISHRKVVSGIGTGSFTANMTGLLPRTTYYIKAYAINSAGVAYGSESSFTTTDIRLCAENWMSQNLTVSTYRNGDPIPQVTDTATWRTLSTGAWCYYNNDPANEARYGKLYNWYAVNDPRGLAPAGWHVPSLAEWLALANCLGGFMGGGFGDTGGKMKSVGTIEAGTGLWRAPNTGATNSSGFTGLPGGIRGYGETGEGSLGYWWSATTESGSYAHIFMLQNNVSGLFRGIALKWAGMSVRCVRD